MQWSLNSLKTPFKFIFPFLGHIVNNDCVKDTKTIEPYKTSKLNNLNTTQAKLMQKILTLEKHLFNLFVKALFIILWLIIVWKL